MWCFHLAWEHLSHNSKLSNSSIRCKVLIFYFVFLEVEGDFLNSSIKVLLQYYVSLKYTTSAWYLKIKIWVLNYLSKYIKHLGLFTLTSCFNIIWLSLKNEMEVLFILWKFLYTDTITSIGRNFSVCSFYIFIYYG